MSDAPNDDALALAASFLSGRLTLYCAKCREHRRLSIQNRGIRIPTVDPHYTAGSKKVRLVCTYCQSVFGYIMVGDVPDSLPTDTRWKHLELDENDAPGTPE